MSIRKRRNRRRATVIGMFMGIIMVLSMMIGLLSPLRSGSSGSTTFHTPTPFLSPEPTDIIIPTPDVEPSLDGEPVYIHPSGYFQTFQPAGRDWQVAQDPDAVNADPTYAGIVLQNLDRLAVIHTYLQQGVEYTSLESLSENYFTAAEFDTNWGQYDEWIETGRTVTGEHLIINFDLSLEEFNYLGRTIAWLDNNFLYVARVVVPDNNPTLLDLLAERLAQTFKGYHDAQELPRSWPVYIDRTSGFMLKHGSGWGMIAGGEGRPTTFRVPYGQVRVMTESDQPFETIEQAEQWVINTEQGVTILNSDTIDREMGTGYAVGYTYQDAAGDPHSGLAVLLTGAEDTAYIANAQIEPPDVNLLVPGDNMNAIYYELRQSLTQGFMVLPDEARTASS